ncbi:MAG: hypothetical protein HY583_02130 [Candidatus Omnitrophica bacterium]|nr:hypothetical protein [Candidatus Omnitrophota bacterium]
MTLIFLIFIQCFPLYSQGTLSISKEDYLLLKKVQKDSFQYFLTQTDPETGLTKDSSRVGAPASIAATGFALVSFAIAFQNGWLSYREAYQKIARTFDTLEQRAAGEKGFFYHFLNPKTGKRIWASELSSIDTAILIASVLLAASYFRGTDLEVRARRLYDRVDWNWMLNGTLLFSHGWKPERGFLPYQWDMYAEHLILQALAGGSETFPVSGQVWREWKRDTDSYNGKEIVYSYTGSLFTYQYSHAFIDFRNLNDGGINYFDNSKKATLANQEFCVLNEASYRSYQNQIWGLSACLGPDGYKAYGAEPGIGLHDGTVAPYAALSSIVFTPAESMSVIRNVYESYGDRLYGPMGFKDSFNLDRNWWASEYLGIDQGITVMMLENFLNDGAIWKRFMRLPAIQRWIERTQLEPQNNLIPA